MKNLRVLTATILIILMASMVAFGATFVNVGPTTEFGGDIGIADEIVAEGATADDFETTIFFTDPTADRTITMPDADVTLGVVTGIVPADHGGTGIANNAAETITIAGAGTFPLTLTLTNTTDVTLPTTGTLATLAGAETLTGKLGYNGLIVTADTGAITTGSWAGTVIPANYGGTGVANNVLNTITFTGNFSLGITLTANTAVTFPTSGIVVSDATDCTDIEGTGLSIAGGVLNWAAPVNSIDSDAYVDASIDHEHLHNDVVHGMTAASLAAADEFMFWDETAGALRKITWTNFMGSITNVGTIVGGTWTGSVIGPAYGGTGVANNALNTLTFTGNYSLGLTLSANTALTVPTSGTLYGTKADSISSANLLSSMSDETGTGALVFGTSPTFTTRLDVTSTVGVVRGIYNTQIYNGIHWAPINFQKARGSVGSLATVVTGDYIGILNFSPHDGTNYLITSGFGARTTGTVGTGSIPTELFFYTGAVNDTNPYGNGTVKMLINSIGNVGIGTVSPTAVLHLKAGTATASTAPLKFTSGTANTTAETGAMEYSGTQLTFVRTGTVREVIGTVLTKTDTGDPTGSEGLFCINTFDDTFKVYADGAWRELTADWTP